MERFTGQETENGLQPTAREELRPPAQHTELNPANNHMNVMGSVLSSIELQGDCDPSQGLDYSLMRVPESEGPAKVYPDS